MFATVFHVVTNYNCNPIAAQMTGFATTLNYDLKSFSGTFYGLFTL